MVVADQKDHIICCGTQ